MSGSALTARRRLTTQARRAAAGALASCLVLVGSVSASVYVVAPSGGDFSTVQAALNVAVAGDTISVRHDGIPYFEKIAFPRDGSASEGFISLIAHPGERPVLDGTGVSGSDMVRMESRSFVRIEGFEIRNNLGVSDGSGIRVVGAGTAIEIRDNVIHDVRGTDAMGITVYGTEPTPISQLVIEDNEIFDCEPARSEALTLNGNVTDFAVIGNLVRDVNNIGIDFIGGETDINPDPSLVVRSGVCRDNTVFRANSNYGGGYAGGIYVDGARDIVIESNVVSGCDLGIEIGAENAGIVSSGVIVRNNLVFGNAKVGIIFGGYEASVGRVRHCRFLNNVCYRNDTLNEGLGELSIAFADTNVVRNNVFYCTEQNVLLYSEAGNVENDLDYNLWYADDGPGGVEFYWNGILYEGFVAYQTGTGQDSSSLFSDPLFVNATQADFHISGPSPARDAGDPDFVPAPGEVDIDGEPRVSNDIVDIGADEIQTPGAVGSIRLNSGRLRVLGPNPSGASIAFGYDLPRADEVDLAVFDVAGRRIRTLARAAAGPGRRTVIWEGDDDAGRSVAPGIYVVRLLTGGAVASRTVVVLY